MANILRLKEQARSYEQKSQWEAALEVYERLVREAPAEEIALWNRIGDLRQRVGDLPRAVEAYEHAADSYAEHGLHNNAIAVCHKILRAAPERTSVYRRLARYSAAQGFLADARVYVLKYTERMQRAGQPDQALEALREIVTAAPDDTQIRQALAEQLQAHGRDEEAVAVRAQLGVDEAAPAPPTAKDEPPQRDLRDRTAPAPGDNRGGAGPESAPRDRRPDQPAPIEGLELTQSEQQWHQRIEGDEEDVSRADLKLEAGYAWNRDESAAAASDADTEAAAEPLPLLGLDREWASGAPPRPSEANRRSAGQEDGWPEEPEVAAGGSQMWDLGAEDSSRHYERGLALRNAGRLDEAIAEFQVALRSGGNPLPAIEALGECFVEKGQYSLAARVLERGPAIPGVEEGDLIGIYYWLGRCHQMLGQPDRARAYLERVLARDFRFRDAAALLEELDAAGE